MADPLSAYLTVLFLGIVLTVLVGVILARSVRPFLEDVFERRETANSMTRLIVVLFHLVVLGMVALIASIDLTIEPPIQAVVVRLGLVLLLLGAAHGGMLLVLSRLRARRRTQLLMAERVRQAEAQHYNGMSGRVPGAQVHPTSTQTYPGAER